MGGHRNLPGLDLERPSKGVVLKLCFSSSVGGGAPEAKTERASQTLAPILSQATPFLPVLGYQITFFFNGLYALKSLETSIAAHSIILVLSKWKRGKRIFSRSCPKTKTSAWVHPVLMALVLRREIPGSLDWEGPQRASYQHAFFSS